MLKIRAATSEDIESLVRLRLALLRDMGHLPDEADPTPLAEATREYLASCLPTGEFRAWIAEDEGQMIACSGLLFFRKPPAARNSSGLEAYILNMYTEPGWRGRGIATALLRECINFVKTTAARQIRLHATADGRPIYLRAGFADASSEMVLRL